MFGDNIPTVVMAVVGIIYHSAAVSIIIPIINTTEVVAVPINTNPPDIIIDVNKGLRFNSLISVRFIRISLIRILLLTILKLPFIFLFSVVFIFLLFLNNFLFMAV